MGSGGTGKTTMMKGIEKEIKKLEKIHTVWFDAWRYENEEKHAVIPLMKKIAYSIDENNKEFETERARKPSLSNREWLKDFSKSVAGQKEE